MGNHVFFAGSSPFSLKREFKSRDFGPLRPDYASVRLSAAAAEVAGRWRIKNGKNGKIGSKTALSG
jgi:hypothetical protein